MVAIFLSLNELTQRVKGQQNGCQRPRQNAIPGSLLPAGGGRAKRGSRRKDLPDSKVHGANMGPIWGWQDSGVPHVGPMNFATWAAAQATKYLARRRYEPFSKHHMLTLGFEWYC